jgi:hypothetical protein
MSKLSIFEPAMCCETGLCGVSVDPELLRISTVFHTLKTSGIEVVRYNLTSNPVEFVRNKDINLALNQDGVAGLPITVVDGVIVKKGSYPTNEELVAWLGLQHDLLAEEIVENSEECGCGSDVSCCSDGDCGCDEEGSCGDGVDCGSEDCCNGDCCSDDDKTSKDEKCDCDGCC